jgi:hypothetical protein
MNKLTAIEILEIKLLGIVSFDSEVLRSKYKEQFKIAKEMEKEHIMEAFDECGNWQDKYSDSEHYYNKTYKKEDK